MSEMARGSAVFQPAKLDSDQGAILESFCSSAFTPGIAWFIGSLASVYEAPATVAMVRKV
jgi:hypothetical protein